MTGFEAEVFQNQYLATGVDAVDAIVTVRTTGDERAPVRPVADRGTAAPPSNSTERVQLILLDISGSMAEENGRKMWGAQAATKAAIETISDGTLFAVVGGNHEAHMVYPNVGLARASHQSRTDAKRVVDSLIPGGGTAMGTWLRAAADLVRRHADGAMAHAILLTDGYNEHETQAQTDAAIEACIGLLQCDARGLGANWNVDEVRRISSALLGTVDIIPEPSEMAEVFRQLTAQSMQREIGSVALRIWMPKGAEIQLVKQVAPELFDLSHAAVPVDALNADYPLGAWSGGEERDYHLRIKIPVGDVGDERLAARVKLVVDGVEQPVAMVRAVWTDNNALSTRLNREVAHYTGQAELAEVIHEGLAARDSGDDAVATMKLGRAVQIAHESGNEETIKLLQKVVDVESAESGTVRLKREVARADEMALDVRSVRTVRVGKGD